MQGLRDESSLLVYDMLELEDFAFALPFSSDWKEVVKALSISFHCGYSSIGCCPLYKRHLLDFEMLLMDPCPVGALFSLNPFIWKLSKIPYSMSKPIFIEICEFYLIDCTPIEPMVLDRRGSIKIYLSRTCLGCLASMHNIASHIPNL